MVVVVVVVVGEESSAGGGRSSKDQVRQIGSKVQRRLTEPAQRSKAKRHYLSLFPSCLAQREMLPLPMLLLLLLQLHVIPSRTSLPLLLPAQRKAKQPKAEKKAKQTQIHAAVGKDAGSSCEQLHVAGDGERSAPPKVSCARESRRRVIGMVRFWCEKVISVRCR